MFRRKIIPSILIGFFLLMIFFSFVPFSSNINNEKNFSNTIKESPKVSASLEGVENILITKIEREAELNEYGLVNIEDQIKIKNMNDNSIPAIFIGIPLSPSESLVFFEAKGEHENTLSIERNHYVMNEFEMITIYFDSPIKPQESQDIIVKHSYIDLLNYTIQLGSTQKITYRGYLFPIMPYRAEGSMEAVYELPDTSDIESSPVWGSVDNFDDTITFTNNTIEPFLTNFENNGLIEIILSDKEITGIEFTELNREIYISPWAIIKVTEEYEVKNTGAIDFHELNFEIPGPAKEVKVYDDLGEILGVEITPEEYYYNLTYKDLYIDLSENRINIDPESKFKFFIEYFLPFEKYYKLNWFQISIKMDLLTSIYEYLARDQTIEVVIEGCLSLDYVSEEPVAIEHSQNSITLVYKTDYVVPFQDKDLQFTYTVNYLDISLRPITFFILIALISSSFVIYVKTRKESEELIAFRKELLPINEIREFCSLYDEKNALLLEIRQAEEDVKRKKIIKKKYRNILDKNKKKIEEVEKEIIPFKKILREVNTTFEILIGKIEVLEAERVSIEDGLNLLEARYKRGRLPSKKAYLNLSDQFLRRQRKVDRSIDKNIQQFRSYLL